jgi:hypothetical protein
MVGYLSLFWREGEPTMRNLREVVSRYLLTLASRRCPSWVESAKRRRIMHQAGSARRAVVLFIVITLLVLGGGSWAWAGEAECPEDAIPCDEICGRTITEDTLVCGETGTGPCTIKVKGAILRFKNRDKNYQPQLCLAVDYLEINGDPGSSLRIEFTKFEAEGSIDIDSFGTLTKIDDGSELIAPEINISSSHAGAWIVFENDNWLWADAVTIASSGGGVSGAWLKDTTIVAQEIAITGDNSSVTVKDDMHLVAEDIIIKTEGSSLDVRGSSLEADSTTITTEMGSSLIVKANTFSGVNQASGDVTIDGFGYTLVYKNQCVGPCEFEYTVTGNPLICKKNKPRPPPPPWPYPECT